MFDIGFSELVVCAVVALIVIGPERMPETVRTIGLWIGRLKRSLRDTREEIERQMGVDDIRRQLHNEEIMRNLEDARRDIDSVIESSQQTIHSVQSAVDSHYRSEQELPYHSHTASPAVNDTQTINTNTVDTNTVDTQISETTIAPSLPVAEEAAPVLTTPKAPEKSAQRVNPAINHTP